MILLFNDFDQLFLIKFITDKFIRLNLYCKCWRFSGRNCSSFKLFLCKVWLVTSPKVSVVLRDANFVSNFKLGFLFFRSGLLYGMDKKSEFLPFLSINTVEQIFSGIQGCDELRQFVNVVLSKYIL